MAIDRVEIRRSVADEYAEKGLNGDHYDHEERMLEYAYAQVQATIYLGDQVGRLADMAGNLRAIADSLEGINQGTGAR